ncbi:uncharacterized protein LOC135092572 [Scylla paramamosain]|uniref:uncharacterized protein LOC135092572 n=1 Tax=Scylla paramamosain TaxID=85552 RepID=UPI0030826DB2
MGTHGYDYKLHPVAKALIGDFQRGGEVVGMLAEKRRVGHLLLAGSPILGTRMQTVRLQGEEVLQVLLVYASQVGRPEEEKEAFWGVLDNVITVADSEILLIASNLNGHIGDDRGRFKEVMGIYGFGMRNREGERILEFS